MHNIYTFYYSKIATRINILRPSRREHRTWKWEPTWRSFRRVALIAETVQSYLGCGPWRQTCPFWVFRNRISLGCMTYLQSGGKNARTIIVAYPLGSWGDSSYAWSVWNRLPACAWWSAWRCSLIVTMLVNRAGESQLCCGLTVSWVPFGSCRRSRP